MIKEFKAFVLRGNVVDLAVAVVIGAAFGAVVTSFVNNILTPLIGIVGKKDFAEFDFTIRDSVFHYLGIALTKFDRITPIRRGSDLPVCRVLCIFL